MTAAAAEDDARLEDAEGGRVLEEGIPVGAGGGGGVRLVRHGEGC